MIERSEDWNVGLTEDLQDDEFVLEFVAAAIEEGVSLKAVLLKLWGADRGGFAVRVWNGLTDEERTAAPGLSDGQKAEIDSRWAVHLANAGSAIHRHQSRRRLRDPHDS
jgi:hypothetical protein